jgi:predicted O-methyltransferase YrrM
LLSPKLKAIALATKGFMPEAEGDALFTAASEACDRLPRLPLVEIGTYCGRSTIWLGAVAKIKKTTLFTVDHHSGSEENQNGWEWFDESLVDATTKKLNTLPTFIETMKRAELGHSVVPIIAESFQASRQLGFETSFCFIDGGHGELPTKVDYSSWTPKIAIGGSLAIHDVFVDPSQGGQAPHDFIYRPAIDSGDFVDELAAGSLRVLRRIKKRDF